MSSIIGKRYALATLEGTSARQWKEKFKDLSLVKETILSSRQLEQALVSLVIKPNKKLSILKALFEKKISDDTLRLLFFMIKKGRGDTILPMIMEFQALIDKKEGILNAHVVSYLTMQDKVRNTLKKSLEKMYDRKIRLHIDVDPSLLGGLKVRIDDTVIDGSLLYKINAMKSYLEGYPV